MTRLYGDDHPIVATALNNLAVQLADQGRDAEAAPMLRRVLAVRRRVLGDHHIECEPRRSRLWIGVAWGPHPHTPVRVRQGSQGLHQSGVLAGPRR